MVTLNNIRFQVAFRPGLVNSLTVTDGDYVVSGPTRMTIPDSPLGEYDVFTLTFTGNTNGSTTSSKELFGWDGAEGNFQVDYNNTVCIPLDGETYYTRYQGSYTVDGNGTTPTPNTWDAQTFGS